MREPALTILADRDPTLRLAATGGRMFPNQPGGVVALTGDFLSRQPAIADRFVALLVRATEALQRNPAAASAPVAAALGRGIVPEDLIRRALVSPASRFIADPRRIVDSTRQMLDFQVRIGATRDAPSLDGVFDHGPFLRATAGGR